MIDNTTKQGYQKSFKKYGVNPKSLKWASAKAAKIRYEQIVKDVDFERKTILDVGCGFGDLFNFIAKQTKNFEYVGIDIVPEFIEAAYNRNRKAEFLVGDYFSNPLSKKFDIVISSGTLNSNRKNHMDYRKRAIKILFSHTKQILIFNMAGNHPQPENKKNWRIYYADSEKVGQYCATLTKNVVIREDYHPKDFTVLMYKN